MNKEYKEMEYQTTRKVEVLMEGKYKDYQFYILNLGTHPTAYVEIPKDHKLYFKCYGEIDNNLGVNGDLTYSDEKLYVSKENIKEGWFIGWDYAHYGDYVGYEINMPPEIRINGKKWTTLEIFEEVKNCIEVLKKENEQ